MYQRRLNLGMAGEQHRELPPAIDLSEFQGLASPWGEVEQPLSSPVHAVPVEVFRSVLKGEVTCWEERAGLSYGERLPTVVRLGVTERPGWPVLAASVVIPLERAEPLPGERMRYTWSFPQSQGA